MDKTFIIWSILMVLPLLSLGLLIAHADTISKDINEEEQDEE